MNKKVKDNHKLNFKFCATDDLIIDDIVLHKKNVEKLKEFINLLRN